MSVARAVVLSSLILSSGAAVAETESGWGLTGVGRLFNNDYFGDNEDRWRTGSYVLSFAFSKDNERDYADQPLGLMELRLRSEVIAPRNLNGAKSSDRAYAGILSVGAHTHYEINDLEISVGTDIVVVGPQTGMMEFQRNFHDRVGAPEIAASVEANQIANGVYPTLTIEIAREIDFGHSYLRPFVEGQYGAEDLIRVGADFQFGDVAVDVAHGRDPVTGQRFKLADSQNRGLAFLLGADYAIVGDSIYFPASFGAEVEDTRYRLRAGLNWEIAPKISFYYGATYLSEEYVGQEEGQIVGSLKLNFNF
jgi:hypothetical protein